MILALNLGTISIFAADSVMTKPSIIEKVQPVYPTQCVQARVEGRVVVECLINSKGEILGATAVRASDPALAEAAVAAVNLWKFAPATKDGVPTDAVIRIPVDFHLDDSGNGVPVPSIIAKS
jgi:protein TonB